LRVSQYEVRDRQYDQAIRQAESILSDMSVVIDGSIGAAAHGKVER